MTGSDRPTQHDPDGDWPGDDPEATRVVRNPPPSQADQTDQSGATGGSDAANTPVHDEASAADSAPQSGWSRDEQGSVQPDQSWPSAPGSVAPDAPTSSDPAPEGSAVTGPNAPVVGLPFPDSTRQPPIPPARYPDRPAPFGDQATQYNQPAASGAAPGYGAAPAYPPTTVIPPTAGYQGGYPGGYQNPAAPTEQLSPGQQGGYQGEYYPGPQVIQAPGATAVVLPPPVKLPNAESRMAINAFGTLIGILLVAGGLVLLLRFAPKLRGDFGGVVVLPTVWTALGALLIAVAALLAAWASWAALVPGAIVTGVSIWAMITPPNGGMYYIDKATHWAVGGQLATAAASGIGLTIGLLLFFAGLAAVWIRAAVRRTIREQLATMQS